MNKFTVYPKSYVSASVEGSTEEMENYYKIMYILTSVSSTDEHKLTKSDLEELDYFAKLGDIHIADVADANDCGGCETWQEIVDEFAYQLSTGERVLN